MANENYPKNNPFKELNRKKLEKEARRHKALRLAEPLDDMVTETLLQLVEATGWSAIVNPLNSLGEWSLYRPSGTSRFSSLFKLTLSVYEDQGHTHFLIGVSRTFLDGSGSSDIFGVPSTKKDLVQALSDAVKAYST
ncbi:hypothetical protein A3A66_01295 [Microgenomates group bacterium RIFCSPLOWO2_01_FULL_46_13]|nr:MAG: hypothetical protein A2783_02400 [Microgenomates group bacterium RIFCSPHIGHO2_01_FULL_45_11]OGV94636.1 MAG: hypothetical protein A3A66_01295 [Microgenomates group bacterium RIFCSPLOWO2_01_FULL_46_13]